MAEMFGRMSQHDTGLLVVRRLDMSGRKVDSPTPPVRSHIHCFLFITGGEVLVTIGDESFFFKSGECAVIPTGSMFAIRYFDNCTGYMGGFHNDFFGTGRDGRNVLQTFAFLRRWGSHKVMFDEDHAKYVSDIFERLCSEQGPQGRRNIQKAYLAALLTEIEEVSAAEPALQGIPLTDNGICNNFIEMAFAMCDYRIPIDEYAEKLNVTKANLHRVVKRFTGKTPLLWITEAVILEAKALLCHTEQTVSQIGAAVGIDDPSYFSRIFRKHTGQTPLAYREASKNPIKS